jgi:hypothetical protein
MYLGVIFVFTMILVLMSPAIWIAWWLLADFGERAAQSPRTMYQAEAPARFRPAA